MAMDQEPSLYLHDFHLQVFMESRGHSDRLQHLAEQLFLQDLHLHADPTHESVLTQELLMEEGHRS